MREVPDTLPALSDVVKTFVWSRYNPGLSHEKPKGFKRNLSNKPRTLKSV